MRWKISVQTRDLVDVNKVQRCLNNLIVKLFIINNILLNFKKQETSFNLEDFLDLKMAVLEVVLENPSTVLLINNYYLQFSENDHFSKERSWALTKENID